MTISLDDIINGRDIRPILFNHVELADNIFACQKEGVYTVIMLDESDY